VKPSGAEVTQKDAFIESEGDAWYTRNVAALGARKLPEQDPVLMDIIGLPRTDVREGAALLEIGCGEGSRLAWLQDNLRLRCAGVDPSAKAVEAAAARGVDARQATADHLPFADAGFDLVVFGFCLYLCDRADLFRIACEADRVLKPQGWLVILDFYSPTPRKRAYHHKAGLFSYKMDYRTLFTWNPAYTTYSHRVRNHADGAYTDVADDWVAVSVLRKNLEADLE
jgi:ubiquinone/menaquinone biosynthesis C-methylase UbiE